MAENAKKRRARQGALPQRGADSYKPTVVPNAVKILFGGVAMKSTVQSTTNAEPSPIKNKVGSLFIPVTNIEKSREWYCRLLGLPADCEIMNGHLCPLPMDGTSIILDTMPMWGGKEPGGAPAIKTPAFTLLTSDLQGAFEFVKENDIALATGIEHDHWFVIKDPDGNLLMVAKE
ncbi:VOC family protein [Cohnella faecalis]|nr:VOC family protein [Cohnella faecalis]